MASWKHRHRSHRHVATTVAGVAVVLASSFAACERTQYWGSSGESPATTTGATSGGPTGPGGGGAAIEPATRAMVLEATAQCTLVLYGEFQSAAADLEARAQEAAAAPSTETRTAARAAWEVAIDAWQQAELFQFGPAATPLSPGGLDLRPYVYSWPLVNRCLIEQTLVNETYETGAFAFALVNVRGLGAIEYLSYYEASDNGCSATDSINSQGKWAAVGPAELATRKLAYASVAAADVAARSSQLLGEWAADGKNFAGKLAAPGTGGSPYASEQQALNAVSDAMFYLDAITKDRKVGKPLGIIDCPTDTCLDDVESPYAHWSKRDVRNNLVGFQRLFAGCGGGDGIGFDNLLAGVGAGALAEKMSADLMAALAAADAIEGNDLAVAIVQDRAGVEALHAAIKRITDSLKTDFITVLDLELPKTVEGDND